MIDANLLVLLIVGSAGRHLVGNHKRLGAFEPSDYDLLQSHLMTFDSVVILPNTLAEASNLAGQVSGPAKAMVSSAIQQIGSLFTETYVRSAHAVVQAEFTRLGLTDCALLSAIEPDDTLLTVDLALYLAAIGRRLDAQNFNHLRPGRH